MNDDMTDDDYLEAQISLVRHTAQKEGITLGPLEWVKLAPMIQEHAEWTKNHRRRYAELMEMFRAANVSANAKMNAGGHRNGQ